MSSGPSGSSSATSSARSSTGGSTVSLPFNSTCTSQLYQNNHNHDHHNHHQHSYNNNNNNSNGRQAKQQLYLAKGKKFIQSIPIPLLATTLLTILILCLLLSECKSLNVMTQASAMKYKQGEKASRFEQLREQRDNEEAIVAMLRSASQDQQAAASGSDGGGGGSSSDLDDVPSPHAATASGLGESDGAQQAAALLSSPNSPETMETPSEQSEQVETQTRLQPDHKKHELPVHPRQQLASLRRNFIASQLMRHHHQQPAAPHQTKRHSQPPSGSGDSLDGGEGQLAALQEQTGCLESLGAMLMSGGGVPINTPLESQQTPRDNSNQAELAAVDSDTTAYLDGGPPRTAFLRSGSLVPLDMDLNGGSQLAVAGDSVSEQQQPQQQQPQPQKHHSNIYQHHSSSNSNNYLNNRHQVNHQQQQHPYNRMTIDQENQRQIEFQQQQQQFQSHPPLNNHDRPFDVVQIQCNNTDEGFERFACPSPDHLGRWRCIEDRLFCDGYFDCPGREDEERVSCMYYKLFISHIDILTNTFLTWMKKQSRQHIVHQQPYHLSSQDQQQQYDVGVVNT